jgi:hypothetical protein
MAEPIAERFQVAEIGAVDTATDVPISPETIERIKEQDDDPLFVTVEIEEGMSRSNRLWTPESLKSIARQVNEKLPVGYKGHIKEQDDPFVLPDPQTIWLGANAIQRNGKTVCRVKGYVLSPEMKKNIRLKAVDGVSVRGDAVLSPRKGGTVEVKDFDLESIDWARKGRSGMKNRIVAVTAEMEGGKSVEPKDIAALTEDELRQHNGLLVKEIENKVKTPLQDTVAEQTEKLQKAEKEQTLLNSIREKLGLDENADILENLSSILDKVEGAVKTEVRNFIKDVVGKKVKTEQGQKLVLRMVGEMEVKPEVNQDGTLSDKTKNEIETKLNETFDKDEDVKAIVSEQVTLKEGAGGGAGLGGKRAPHGYDRGESRENENIVVGETRFGG